MGTKESFYTSIRNCSKKFKISILILNSDGQKGSIALFIAATSALSIATTDDLSLNASENDIGGLKEWNTDMPIEADFVLDEAAQKLADEAAKSTHVCLLEKEKIAGKNNQKKNPMGVFLKLKIDLELKLCF